MWDSVQESVLKFNQGQFKIGFQFDLSLVLTKVIDIEIKMVHKIES